MANNFESRIEDLERQYGKTGYKLVLRSDNETDDEAKGRAGLANWPGVVIFCNEIDAKL